MSVNIAALKEEVLNSVDRDRLYQITVELAEIIAAYHKLVFKSQDELEKIDIKGKLSICHAMQKVLDQRVEDLKVKKQQDDNAEFFTNRRFRNVAELTLKKETFTKILELAQKDFKEIKLIKNELRAEKME